MKTTETAIAHRYELPYLDLGIQVIATVAQYGLGEDGPWYAIATLYPEPSDGPKCLWGCNGYPTRAAAQADLARWLSRHRAKAIESLDPTPFKEVLAKAMKDSGFSTDTTVAELKYALVYDAIDREKLRERMDRFDIPTDMSLNEIRAALKDPLRDGYQ